MDGDGGGCDSDRGMSNTRLAARANHAVAAELHTTCGISKLEDVQDRARTACRSEVRCSRQNSELDETQLVHSHHEEEKQEFHTNISTHPHIHVDGARRGPVRRPASRVGDAPGTALPIARSGSAVRADGADASTLQHNT